jgi:hypothetical protein
MSPNKLDISSTESVLVQCHHCNSSINTTKEVKHSKWYQTVLCGLALFPFCMMAQSDSWVDHYCPVCKKKLGTANLSAE